MARPTNNSTQRHGSTNKHKGKPQWTNSTITKQRKYECDKDRYPTTIKKSKHPCKKCTHFFDGLHSASLISLFQLCKYDNIEILDKNEMKILKEKKLILKLHRHKTYGLWHIPISITLGHCDHVIITRDKTKIELIQCLHGCYFRPTPINFLKAIKMETSLHGQASPINNC